MVIVRHIKESIKGYARGFILKSKFTNTRKVFANCFENLFQKGKTRYNIPNKQSKYFD